MSLTLKDIARIASVSTATVSKVINGKDQNIGADTSRINAIVAELDYRPYPGPDMRLKIQTSV